MAELFRNYIDGQWVEGAGTFENRNPADSGEVVGLFARGTSANVVAAAEAAQAAFPAWAGMAAPARGSLLFKAADILERNFEQISAEMTREEGKTLPESKGEVRRSINVFRYFGGEGARLPGLLVPSERDRVHMFSLRKPLGVVGLITP
ncbi:MAG TPA: aldehyde dehydrogenase family protein, partial [Bryobacteraceae bacterium]